jgi:hypothetical protein
MSHASLIVALSREQLNKAGSVEKAVEFQMEPFDENGEWFKDGSRWDWWVIGGRFTGRLALDGYSSHTDPRNFEECKQCDGRGMRNDALGIQARERDPSYTCNGCNGSGRSLKWSNEFVKVGNVCLRSDLSEEKLKAHQVAKANALWAKWQAEKRKDDFTRDNYGFKEGETLDSLVERCSQHYLTAYAFLKDRRWCENERLGFFGCSAKTECELKSEERGEEGYQGRCIVTDEETASKIVVWGDEEERWDRMYWPRFIRGLSGDTTLAVVDYHV